MEILFESNSEQEEEFEYDGQVIVNKGHVQIIRLEESVTDEADII
jgi:hypothetical protein